MRITSAGRPFRILLVEDSLADARLVREALKETCIPVNLAVARDGMEASDYLNQVESNSMPRPDLILLDLDLPRKSGRQSARRSEKLA